MAQPAKRRRSGSGSSLASESDYHSAGGDVDPDELASSDDDGARGRRAPRSGKPAPAAEMVIDRKAPGGAKDGNNGKIAGGAAADGGGGAARRGAGGALSTANDASAAPSPAKRLKTVEELAAPNGVAPVAAPAATDAPPAASTALSTPANVTQAPAAAQQPTPLPAMAQQAQNAYWNHQPAASPAKPQDPLPAYPPQADWQAHAQHAAAATPRVYADQRAMPQAYYDPAAAARGYQYQAAGQQAPYQSYQAAAQQQQQQSLPSIADALGSGGQRYDAYGRPISYAGYQQHQQQAYANGYQQYHQQAMVQAPQVPQPQAAAQRYQTAAPAQPPRPASPQETWRQHAQQQQQQQYAGHGYAQQPQQPQRAQQQVPGQRQMPGIAERREMIERIRRHLPKRDAVEAANAESRIYDKALEYLDWGWYHSEMDRLYPPKQRKQRADGTAGSDSDDSVILVGDRNRAPAAPAAPAAQVPAAPLDRAEKALKGLYDTHGLQYQTRDDRQAAADAARAAEKLAAAEARASALEEQNRKLNQSNQKLANEVQRLQALASDPDEIGKLKVQLQEAHAAMAANNDRAAELVKEIEQWKAVAEGPEPPPTKKAPKQAERNKQLSKTNRELLATVRTYQVLEKDTARLLDRLRRENAYFRSKLKLPQVPYGSGAGVAAGGGVPKLPKPRKPGHLPTVARAPAASSSSAAAGGDGAGEAPPKGGTLVTFPPRPKPSGSGSLQAPSVPGALPEAWTSRAPGAASGSGSGSAQQPATPTSTEAPSLPAYASSQAPAQPITAAPVVLPIAPHQQERERERLVLPEKKATRMDLDSDRD